MWCPKHSLEKRNDKVLYVLQLFVLKIPELKQDKARLA